MKRYILFIISVFGTLWKSGDGCFAQSMPPQASYQQSLRLMEQLNREYDDMVYQELEGKPDYNLQQDANRRIQDRLGTLHSRMRKLTDQTVPTLPDKEIRERDK